MSYNTGHYAPRDNDYPHSDDTNPVVPIHPAAAALMMLHSNELGVTTNEQDNDYICPICRYLIREAYITRCGHTFCYECIVMMIGGSTKRCPECGAALTSYEMIFPNYLLDQLIRKYKMQQQLKEATTVTNSVTSGNDTLFFPNDEEGKLENQNLKNFITAESDKLALPDVNIMLEILQQRKQVLEAESNLAQNRLLYEFLKQLLKVKEEQRVQVVKEIRVVQKDLETVENELKNMSDGTQQEKEMKANTMTTPATNSFDSSADPPTQQQKLKNLSHSFNEKPGTSSQSSVKELNTSPEPADSTSFSNFLSRKRRMYSHFDNFVSSYFSTRSHELHLGDNTATLGESEENQQPSTSGAHMLPSPGIDLDGDDKMKGTSSRSIIISTREQGLDVFREKLVKFSRYSTLRPLATMHYSSDMHASSMIVSSIVFDKDNEYFAIGGVTRRIKIYDYLAVIRDAVDIHYPCVEMVSGSKISCIAWNRYHKGMLASSDYDGAVNIWDVTTGQRTKCFHEHEKRCWSVDFNEVDARLIVSGSDDSRVKLWSLRDDHSIATLEAKANVCCVKFNPKSSCHLAFGSADHDVHYYDLRNMNKAVCIFKGHKKAVSYVKFLNPNEIISASTDSQLKMWSTTESSYCLRSFTGHVNEKNFVGLSTDGDYIACGSEDNSLYVYYKGLPKPLMSYKIEHGPRVVDLERSTDYYNEFVSAVCWRKQCNVILAANSRGLIKVLELV